MRKIALTFFSLNLCLFLTIFLVFLNVTTFLSPDRVKNFLDKSSIYPLISGIIRDEFAKKSSLDLGQGQNLEVLNETINNSVVKIMIADTVDQIFSAQKTKEINREILIDYSPIVEQFEARTGTDVLFSGDDNRNQLSFSLGGGLLLKIIFNLQLLVLLIGVIVLISIASIILLAKDNRQRFFVLGFTLIGSLVALLMVFGGMIYINNQPQLLLNHAEMLDIRLINGLKRIIGLLSEKLRILYIFELIVLAIISAALLFFGQSYKTTKIDILK